MTTIRDENASAALDRIAEVLTEAQCVALVIAWRQTDGRNPVPVSANERTIGALMKGSGPLVEEMDGRRFLTGIGEDLARHLAGTRNFDIPDFGVLLPDAR